MLPRVIQFNEVSLDGRMDWFTGDVGMYYGLAARWKPDAMLSGSNTMLPAFASVEELPEGEEAEPHELHPNHVDMRAALEELYARYGVKVVRVDSGGRLNGVLFRAGLVDEVSVLINACLVGGTSPRSIFRARPDLAGRHHPAQADPCRDIAE